MFRSWLIFTCILLLKKLIKHQLVTAEEPSYSEPGETEPTHLHSHVFKHTKHHRVSVSPYGLPISTSSQPIHTNSVLKGIESWGQVLKEIDFFLVCYIEGKQDKDRERKSKWETRRAINFPAVSSIAGCPFHTSQLEPFLIREIPLHY